MIVFKVTILVFLFLIGNSIVGMFLLALGKGSAGKKSTKNYGLAKDFLAGTFFVFGLFALLTFLVIYKGLSFYTLSKWYAPGYFGILLCSILFLLIVKRFRVSFFKKMSELKSKEYWKEQVLWVILFLLIGVTFFMHRPYLESRFDLPERMSTLEAVGTFSGVNPLTGGGAQVTSALEQWTKGVMPAWYLLFSNLFHISTYQMLFWVVPLWTLCLCMCAYYSIAQLLFGEHSKRIKAFMIFFTMFTLCGNGAYMNPSYGLLHYGYEESTLLSNVVLPCVFALILWIMKMLMNKKDKKQE